MRYIGSKKLLLKDIERVIDENVASAESFCDVFSGTVSVAKYFKNRYKIISNDLLGFSYFIQKGFIENNKVPTFERLKKTININDPITYFNSLKLSDLEALQQEKRFCQNNYSPLGNRMYMSDSNALKIDYIRNKINEWKDCFYINDSEYYYLVATLVEAVPFISNISGTYGAYNKWWDKRALKELELTPIEVVDNDKQNESYNCDGNELLAEVSGDILYIDPPYNNRQYAPNYHVLETVALYDNPLLNGVTGQRSYSDKKSLYCNKTSVLKAFEDLIKKAKFKHVILSYSTEGLMSIEEIENVLKTYGKEDSYKLYKIPYRRFKSRISNQKEQLKELLFYIEKEIC